MHCAVHLLTVCPGKNPTLTALPILSLVSLLLKVLTLPRVDAECQLQCSGQLIGGNTPIQVRPGHTGQMFSSYLSFLHTIQNFCVYISATRHHIEKPKKQKLLNLTVWYQFFHFQLQITRRFGDLLNALKSLITPHLQNRWGEGRRCAHAISAAKRALHAVPLILVLLCLIFSFSSPFSPSLH